MRAVLMRSFGGPEVLAVEEVEVPEPGPDEVLVRVGAVEVSRTRDVATRSGRHPFSREVTLPHVLGGDFAGQVERVGPRVDASLVGRRVAVMNGVFCGRCTACDNGLQHECVNLNMIGIHRWGSYAEFARVPAANLYEIPDDVGMAEAAAMAATGCIALMQLREAHIGTGERILVTGLTGALSSVLAALAPVFGVRTIGLSRRVGETAPALDATVLDANRTDLSEAILAATGGAGPDAVVDNVSTPAVFDRYFPVLRNGARIIVSGAIGNPDLPVLSVPAASMYIRSISLVGVRAADHAAIRGFWDLVHDGFRLPAGLLHLHPMAAAADTHAAVLDGRAVGHTVLRIDEDL